MVLPTVVHLCLDEGDFTDAKQELWEETRNHCGSIVWHKDYCSHSEVHWLLDMASIRALAQYFREQLPKARTVTI